MNREITMEAVFRAGFDAGFAEYDEYADQCMTTPGSEQEGLYRGKFLKLRNEAWLEYVKGLEQPEGR